SPTNTDSASCISPVDIPRKYSHGSAASTLFALRTYGGTRIERNTTGSCVRLLTFGTRTDTGPIPVSTSRSRTSPLRTTAARPYRLHGSSAQPAPETRPLPLPPPASTAAARIRGAAPTAHRAPRLASDINQPYPHSWGAYSKC